MSHTWSFFFIILDSIFLSLTCSNSGLANVSYNLTLNLNLNDSSFDGKLEIQATAVKKITEIILNKRHPTVSDVQIFSKDFLVDCPIDLEQDNDTISIKVPSSVGNYGIEFELSMSFRGLKFPRVSYSDKDSKIR